MSVTLPSFIRDKPVQTDSIDRLHVKFVLRMKIAYGFDL